jgi:hypothetical protein
VITPPSDAELNAFMETRFRLSGIDLSVLPATGDGDPVTGAPSRELVLLVMRLLIGIFTPPVEQAHRDPQQFPPVMFPAQAVSLRESSDA